MPTLIPHSIYAKPNSYCSRVFIVANLPLLLSLLSVAVSLGIERSQLPINIIVSIYEASDNWDADSLQKCPHQAIRHKETYQEIIRVFQLVTVRFMVIAFGKDLG